jgi:DNA polymerase-3 subunit alpha
MDFLGLKTLTIIQEAVRLVREGHGIAVDVDRLPFDDPDTLALYGRGDTVAVFQFESSGMQEMLRRVGIGRFEDTIAMNALYRPGPMQFIDEFGNRKNGKSKIEYDHPLLESILKETYGFMIYQEQVRCSRPPTCSPVSPWAWATCSAARWARRTRRKWRRCARNS